MNRLFIWMWTCLFLCSPGRPATIPDSRSTSSSSKSNRYKLDISLKLHDKCLQEDATACIGYKLYSAATSFIANSTETGSKWQSEDVGEVKRAEMNDQVDNMMLKMLLAQLEPENSDSYENNEVQPRRTMQFNKKMVMPVLMGIVLKIGSLVPLILGKLAFIGSTALMASTLSLLIMGIIAVKKLFSGSDGGGMSHMSHHQGHHYGGGYQDQQAYYGDLHAQGAMQMPYQQQQQRISYLVRGRQLGDEEYWKPSEGTGARKGVNTVRAEVPRQEKVNETSPSLGNTIPYS